MDHFRGKKGSHSFIFDTWRRGKREKNPPWTVVSDATCKQGGTKAIPTSPSREPEDKKRRRS